MAEQFKAQHPGTTFDIAAEGSTTGIAAIIDGTAQIGMSSRRAKPAEVGAASAKGVNMKPTIVAYDGIAVIVNSANPIKGLTKKQVEQIFTGDVTDWSAVGGIRRQDFCLYPQHFIRHLFRLQGAGDEETRLRGGSQKMAGNEQIAAEVGKNRERRWLCRPGLHEGGRSKGHADRRRVTRRSQTVHAKTYPYARPTFYYTNGEPSGLAKEFLDFTIGPAGQKIVRPGWFRPNSS